MGFIRTAKVYYKKDRRYVYTTPKSYLELLKLYKDLLARKRDQMGKGIDRYITSFHYCLAARLLIDCRSHGRYFHNNVKTRKTLP